MFVLIIYTYFWRPDWILHSLFFSHFNLRASEARKFVGFSCNLGTQIRQRKALFPTSEVRNCVFAYLLPACLRRTQKSGGGNEKGGYTLLFKINSSELLFIKIDTFSGFSGIKNLSMTAAFMKAALKIS